MAQSIGKKGNFGFITTKLLENAISTKSRNNEGEYDISKAGKRSLEHRHGYAMWGIGKRSVTKTSLKHTSELRDIDLERIIRNSGSRLISFHADAGLRFSEYDSGVKNRVNRYFYNGVKHLTALKKKNSLVPSEFSKLMRNNIATKLEELKANLSERGAGKLARYQNILSDLIEIQMSHYSTGTGKRNVKLDHLVRVSSIIDEFLVDIESQVEQKGDNIKCEYIDNIGEWINDIGGKKAHQNVNSFLRKVYKSVLVNKGEENSLNKVYPKDVQEVTYAVSTLKKFIIAENEKNNLNIQVNGNAFLQSAIYQGLMDKISELALPISVNVATELVDGLNKVRNTLMLEPPVAVHEIFPEDSIYENGSRREVGTNNTVASSYTNLITSINNIMSGEYNAKQEHLETINQIKTYLPEMASFLEFVTAAHTYITQGEEYKVQKDLEHGKSSGKEFESCSQFLRNSIEGFAQDVEVKEGSEALLNTLATIENRITDSVNIKRAQSIGSKVKKYLANETTDATRIAFKRFGKGIYNVLFGQTLAGQSVRTALRAGLLGAGMGVSAVSLPGAMLASGGNVLLQMIHLAELKKFGIGLGVTLAGLLPWGISSRHTHARRVRKVNNIRYRGAVGTKAGFFGEARLRNNIASKEQKRIAGQEQSREFLPDYLKALNDKYNQVRKTILQSQGVEKQFIGLQESDVKRIQDVRKSVQHAIDTLPQEDKRYLHILMSMKKDLFMIAHMQEADFVLKAQENAGKLTRNAVGYAWNEGEFPSEDISREEHASLTGLYIISKALQDVQPSTISKEKLSYNNGLLKDRIASKTYDITNPRFLAASLDEQGNGYVRNVLTYMKENFPKEFNSSPFAKKMLEAVTTVAPNSLQEVRKAIPKQKSEAVTVEKTEEDIHVAAPSDQDTPIEQKRLGDIQASDIERAIQQGSFVDIILKSLSLYSPYTREGIPAEGVKSLYTILNQYDAKYKGSFTAELVHSLLQSAMDTSGYADIIQTVLEQTTKPEGDSIQLQTELILDESLINQGKNNVIITSQDKEEALKGQLSLLRHTILQESSQSEGGTQRTQQEEVSGVTSPPAGETSSVANRDEIDKAIATRDINKILSPHLLEQAYKDKKLGSIAQALVNIYKPQNEEERARGEWVHHLFDTLDRLQDVYRGELYGLVSLDIENRVLSKIKVPEELVYGITRSLIERTLRETGDLEYGFYPFIQCTKEQMQGADGISPLFESPNIEEAFVKSMEKYIVAEENTLLDILQQARIIKNPDMLLDTSTLRLAKSTKKLPALVKELVRLSVPVNEKDKGNPLWISNLYQKIKRIPEVYQKEVAGLATIELENSVIATTKDTKLQRAMAHALLAETTQAGESQEGAGFQSWVDFNKDTIEGAQDLSPLWKENDISSAILSKLESYALNEGDDIEDNVTEQEGQIRTRRPNIDEVSDSEDDEDDFLLPEVKVQIARYKVLEYKELKGLYSSVAQEYERGMHLLQQISDGRITSMNQALELTAIYLKLETMVMWGKLPGDYSPYGTKENLLQNVETMYKNLRKQLIDMDIYVGDIIANSKFSQVYEKANRFLKDAPGLNRHLANHVYITESPSNKAMRGSLGSVLEQLLLPFASKVQAMNVQRDKRERLLQDHGKDVSLNSTPLMLTDVLEGLLGKAPILRHMLKGNN